MEEIEVPLENAQEQIHETAHHAKESWVGKVALLSALLAVIAAVAALMAGHHSNEAMVSQIKASDAWSYYQAKGIKASILQSKTEMITELRKSPAESDSAKLEQYKKDQEEISEKAKELEHESAHHLMIHEILARAVTMFQVAIAIAAITVLTRRKRFLFVSMAFSILGVLFFIQSFFT